MTPSSEKFCLKWNDFQQNIISSYHDLRKDSDFCDVTLVSEEDQHIKAHRIILSACSPFFSTVLRRNKHSHPMIYMRGVKAKDLVAIVDFIYHGEANIYQDDLDGFLILAEELQLKGLAREETSETTKEKMKKPKYVKPTSKTNFEEDIYNTLTSGAINNKIVSTFESRSIALVDADKLMVPENSTNESLKSHLDSMIANVEGTENMLICTVCRKTTEGPCRKQNMRIHIETHIEGLSYPCNQCGKISR